jgi:hypothetical protein
MVVEAVSPTPKRDVMGTFPYPAGAVRAGVGVTTADGEGVRMGNVVSWMVPSVSEADRAMAEVTG